MVSVGAKAQRRLDTLRLDSIKIFPKSKFISNLVKKGVESITRDPVDTSNQDAAINTRSENPFLKYEGKSIRDIVITRIGFKQRSGDSTKKLEALGNAVMNALHIDTKEWVIRNNLFIREGRPLNAFTIADNERYLRTLNFIQDARIVVKPLNDSSDTVDVEVITRDVFTLSAGLDMGSLQHFKASVSEANLLGAGQQLKFTALYHQDRDPVFAYRMQYSKNSIAGSFINGSAGYSTASPSLADGKEEETNYFVSFDRPLASPNMRFAGGIYLAHRFTEKAYHNDRPDSVFYRYSLNAFDSWIGYNIASEKLNTTKIRDRRFLSLRYAQNIVDQQPYQVNGGFHPLFNDVQLALAQITFFRQDFYKTNYIYGFGITEDIPYGYNIAVTGGWHKQLYLERPYAGLRAERYIVSKAGEFYRLYFRGGSFYEKLGLEDGALVIGGSAFSRLMQWKNVKIRQYMSLSYSGLFNRRSTELLRINNPFGLHNFHQQHINGDQRIGVFSESYFYLKYQLLSFKFAPFITANAVAITPPLGNFTKADIYTGIGGGIRSRNENLVFGTIELRSIFFPRRVEGEPAFKIMLNTDLRYRYNSNYVNKPSIIDPNFDDGG